LAITAELLEEEDLEEHFKVFNMSGDKAVENFKMMHKDCTKEWDGEFSHKVLATMLYVMKATWISYCYTIDQHAEECKHRFPMLFVVSYFLCCSDNAAMNSCQHSAGVQVWSS
jgi:hypothetical protein